MKKCVILFTIVSMVAHNVFSYCLFGSEEAFNAAVSESVSAAGTPIEEFFAYTQLPAALIGALIQNGSAELPDMKKTSGKKENDGKERNMQGDTAFIPADNGSSLRIIQRLQSRADMQLADEPKLSMHAKMMTSLKRFLFKWAPPIFPLILVLFTIRARSALPLAGALSLRPLLGPDPGIKGIGHFYCLKAALLRTVI